MRCTIIVVLTALALAGNSHAETGCASSVGTYRSLVECAEARAPGAQNAQLELEKAKAEVQAAGQWKNPELSAEGFRGKVASEDRSETDVALGIPIELGGKISARTSQAESRLEVAEANLQLTKAEVRAQLILKLHRLRQVLHEREVVEEAIGTFSKLVGQYTKRPGLSPEQQISSSVFQLSRSEYELKKAALDDEIFQIDSYLKLAAGVGFEQVKGILPDSPKNWPSIVGAVSGRLSPKQKILNAEVTSAVAGLSVAQSEAWPTLTVGPSVKLLNESGRSSQLMGLNLGLPLPLFNFNGGAKAAASAEVKVSELKQQVGLREQILRREELVKTYEQSVKVMSGSLSHQEIQRRHTEADRLFSKGVVPSSLVIESHRTSFELEKTRHERELKAMEALFEIYAIDGNILEVIL